MFEGKAIHLGMFLNTESAGRAYDVAAIAYYNEFADTNGGGKDDYV